MRCFVFGSYQIVEGLKDEGDDYPLRISPTNHMGFLGVDSMGFGLAEWDNRFMRLMQFAAFFCDAADFARVIALVLPPRGPLGSGTGGREIPGGNFPRGKFRI